MKLSIFQKPSALFAAAALLAAAESPDDPRQEIRALIQAQQSAWNRGDIEGFMNGYWRSEETVFVSGDEVMQGWQRVLERYRQKYPDHEKMGSLTFSELKIDMLSNDAAVVLGRWELKRNTDNPHGRFTLIFRKMLEGWRIIHDHTSAAAP
ncbi:MAG TPA: SgcJ/EcaC family oxidoreductase [Chthoniobacterales bacterium]|nr:SgcJ/EcaC family oxidoreductase [Chthoniobacterales bacterium]